jgi:hypothetical protein
MPSNPYQYPSSYGRPKSSEGPVFKTIVVIFFLHIPYLFIKAIELIGNAYGQLKALIM